MATCKLFDSWTWSLKDKDFEKLLEVKTSTEYKSRYNAAHPGKSTLHAPSLRALMYWMALVQKAPLGCGIGLKDDLIVAEYQSFDKDETRTLVVVDTKTGAVKAGIMPDRTSPITPYIIQDGKHTGTAILFSLLPLLEKDAEFKDHFAIMLSLDSTEGTEEEITEKLRKEAFILCDNIYRRIESATTLDESGVRIKIAPSGNIPVITQLALNNGDYDPDKVLAGEFKILEAHETGKEAINEDKESSFTGSFTLNPERILSDDEKERIPKLASWYVIPDEVKKICRHAKSTTGTPSQMRNFMMRGKAGGGKTSSAKAIAAGFGLPYVALTCSANTEISDLIGQMLPDTDHKTESGASFPTLQDIALDPATAYKKLTGKYDESVTEDMVYDALLKAVAAEARGKDSVAFKYVESDLVKAMRYGWVIELQEPSVISNPGVLVGLNGALDEDGMIALPTGEVIRRHPDTVFIITTNNDYAGCKQVNQSIISRMKLVVDVEDPSEDTMAERVMGITGCTDKATVKRMVKAVKDIDEYCHQQMIRDGSCGMRELIAWVQSFMVDGNILEAAKDTILSSVSCDPENREDVRTACLEPVFGK